MRASGALWLIAGVGIGAGCTYLFATREGRRFRRKVYRTAQDYSAEMLESGREMMDKGKDLLDRGKAFASNTREFLGHRARRASHA